MDELRTSAARGRWWLLLLLVVCLVACDQAAPEFRGLALSPLQPAPEFSLRDASGRLTELSDFSDSVVLLYFGYTFCPDICPTTLATLARVQRLVDDAGEKVRVVMISVDPERDTPQITHSYASSFHPSFVGLSGDQAEVEAAAAAYGVFVQTEEGNGVDGYLVTHTSRVYAIDGAGMLRLTFPFETPADDIAYDVQLLLNE